MECICGRTGAIDGEGGQKGGLGLILPATTRASSQAAHRLLLNVVVHPAKIQDRDGAFFPFIERIFADGG
jgi:hypothetical protein